MRSQVIYIDFDHTICPGGWDDNPPQPECVRKINEWYGAGHTIVIYSCRSNPETSSMGKAGMIDYLNRHGIQYHGFNDVKPYFDVLIDDRAAGAPKTKSNIDWSRISI